MPKKFLLLIFCFLLLTGCAEKEIKTYISNDDKIISISYPVTNINIVDDAISSYINKTYNSFMKEESISKPELNISYTYKEVNEDIINISLQTEMITNKTTNKIKTFTYNKKNQKFLTMEDIVGDLDALDYDIKKVLLEKYQDADMDYLSNVSYDFFTIDDENLTIYFNPAELKGTNYELVYLDIPLNSLNLLININKTQNNDNYINIKKKNIQDNDKIIALTFDDGPSKYTDEVLKILKENDACATFFLIGNKVEFYKDTLQEMLKNGNEIGNHSYDHKYLTRLSESEFKEEIQKTQDVIKKITGFTPTLFRPSYGGYNNTLKTYTDLTFVLWDVDSKDWSVKTEDKILKNVMPNVKSGSIVLMHDNHDYALKALPELIKELKEHGYKFVTVSELLEIKQMRES